MIYGAVNVYTIFFSRVCIEMGVLYSNQFSVIYFEQLDTWFLNLIWIGTSCVLCCVFYVVLFFYVMVQFFVLLYSFFVLLYSSVLLYCSLLFIVLCSSCYVCTASYLTVCVCVCVYSVL